MKWELRVSFLGTTAYSVPVQPTSESSAIVVNELVAGFLRFRESAYPKRAELFHSLAHEPAPGSLFSTCSDSRVVPELLTQQEPGSLFVVRNAGNIVPSNGPEPGGVSASVEYAIVVLGVRDAVICGHSDCGAMSAIAQHHDLSHLPAVSSWLRHADAAKAINDSQSYDSDQKRLAALVRENVIAQFANLRTHPAVVRALNQNRLRLHGWVYDIESGQIGALDGASGTFVPLSEHPDVAAFGGGAAAL